jgi:hypothetical protein
MTGSMGSTRGGAYKEVELTEAVQLCDRRGNLLPASVGWSRHPLHTCNLRGHWLRKKKWNYWCVTNDSCLFSVTLANIDYIGLAFVYFLEYETKRFIEQTVMVPLGIGCFLPDTVSGDISFQNRAMNFEFTEDQGCTRLHVDSPAFGGTTLSAELRVEHPKDHETLNVVIPWSKSRFNFTSKQNCLPTTGTVSIGDQTFNFGPGRAFACLDYGRGIWRYSTAWNWGSFSGGQNGRTIGVNLGGTWTDGTGLTENGICVDGRISKVGEDVRFVYDRSDFMKPWAVRTQSSERIDLKFTPFFERIAKTDLLIVKSAVRQVRGRFSGTVVPDNGEALGLEGMIGWVEWHEARW